ncbi:MAG: tRNA (adenosine(37)-N6)-threonylcarbamoyltransferase complex ATPase subunit type 1 TsaE [Phycisphaerales bacterium]
MIRIVRECGSEDETRRVAAELAAALRPGDAVLIDGELGAGKTTLIRGVVGALGHDAAMVSSPTFVISHEYRTAGRPTVVHIDAYRLSGSEDAGQLGLEAVAAAERPIVLVEWASRLDEVGAGLGGKEGVARLVMEHAGETRRVLRLDVPEAWLARRELALFGGSGWAVCRVSGRAVPPGWPTFPFADERSRMADLYGWFSESYRVTRPMREEED